MKQRIERQVYNPLTGRASKVVLEQSVDVFEVGDMPDAIATLLDSLGYSGNVFDTIERLLLREAVRRTNNNHAEAARMLGITGRAICHRYKKMKQLDETPEIRLLECSRTNT